MPARGARRRCASARCASWRRPATPRRCSTRTARRPPTTATPARCSGDAARATRGRHPASGDRREARRRVAAPGPGRRGDRGLGRVPRLAPRPGGPRARGRPAPQDRRRALPQGRAQGRDRALPEGHQPAEGRPAAPRAGAALRGGRLALPAHRRQHARHLRVREGAAPGRAPGRDAAPPAAPTGSSAACSAASATPRRRARTSSARWSSRAARTTARRSWPCPRSGATSRSPRPTWTAHARPTRRRWRWPSRWACCPPRSSCTPGSPSSPSTGPTGSAWRAPPRPAPSWPSARGWWASSASPTRCAGCCAGARDSSSEATVLFRRAHELAEQVGWSELVVPGALRPGHRAARRRRPRRAPRRRSTGPSTCASAPGWWPSRSRPSAPAPWCSRSPRRLEAAREAAERGRASWPSACTTRSAGPRRSRRAAPSAEDPAEGAGAAGRGRGGLGGAGAAARGRPLAPAGGPGARCASTPRAARELLDGGRSRERAPGRAAPGRAGRAPPRLSAR